MSERFPARLLAAAASWCVGAGLNHVCSILWDRRTTRSSGAVDVRLYRGDPIFARRRHLIYFAQRPLEVFHRADREPYLPRAPAESGRAAGQGAIVLGRRLIRFN